VVDEVPSLGLHRLRKMPWLGMTSGNTIFCTSTHLPLCDYRCPVSGSTFSVDMYLPRVFAPLERLVPYQVSSSHFFCASQPAPCWFALVTRRFPVSAEVLPTGKPEVLLASLFGRPQGGAQPLTDFRGFFPGLLVPPSFSEVNHLWPAKASQMGHIILYNDPTPGDSPLGIFPTRGQRSLYV